MRDLENMLQGLGEKNKKAEQEGITMTDLEKKRIFAQTMTKIEQEKVNENRDKKNRRWRTAGKAAAAVTAVVLVGIGGTKAAAALGLVNAFSASSILRREYHRRKSKKWLARRRNPQPIMESAFLRVR